MKLEAKIGLNDGEVADIQISLDGGKITRREFHRLGDTAEEFRAAFPEDATVAIKEEWLEYSDFNFDVAMSVLLKLRQGAGRNNQQQPQQQITVPVPSALHARLNEWNAKRMATAPQLQQVPRTLRYDYLRSEGFPAAVAKGLRDKPFHVDALPLQGNKGAEVQLTPTGIRVPVLDRQAVIPVEWPAPVAAITRISFAQQQGDWFVTISWAARAEQQTEQPVAAEEAVTEAA
jgi:hypothetical protein